MKFIKEKSKPLPKRPTFPQEARKAALQKRLRELGEEIIAAEATAPAHPDGDVSSAVDREAYALVNADPQPKPKSDKPNLKALLHERAVVTRAIEIATGMITDLRAAWAAQELGTRLDDYRAMVRETAVMIAALQRNEKKREEFLTSFGSATGRPQLPCARFNLAQALGVSSVGPLYEFVNAALAAGIVTKSELADV